MSEALLLLNKRDEDAFIQSGRVSDLIEDFNELYGVELESMFLNEMPESSAGHVATGNLLQHSTEAAIRTIEEFARSLSEQSAKTSQRRIVSIAEKPLRVAADEVILALSELDEKLRSSNEAGSEVGILSEFQRQVLLTALQQMMVQLEGPIANTQLVSDLSETLETALEEGARKGISEIVRDAIKTARDKLWELASKLPSEANESWPSISDIFSSK